MKNTLLSFLLLTLSLFAYAQVENPVHWSYGLKKISSAEYEVHLLAKIDVGWHIYAEKQARGAVCIPTQIEFKNQDKVALIGKIAEVGRKESYIIKEIGITNFEYAGKVDFVQKVRIKPDVKEIPGTIEFQACTHEHCLPADNITFSIPVP
jgi:hypothetical protein